MNIELMQQLIRHLAKKRMYEIIFVLLMVHRSETYVKDIPCFMLLNMMIENWSGKRKYREQMINDIFEYFE